jgi:hypothetical protein
MHEPNTQHSEIKRGSDRSFGFVFTAFFSIITATTAWYGSNNYQYFLLLTLVFCIISIVKPLILKPLNILWFKFGILLHHIVSPIILGLLFFTVVTVTGLLMRIFGKRPLNLRFDPNLRTYWINRNPPGPKSDSFNNQF